MQGHIATYMIAAYFACINLYGCCLFGYDKYAATHARRRVKESRLHLTEALGSVFAIVPMMYLIRHKNKKPRYYVPTYLILAGWLCLIGWVLFTYWHEIIQQ